MSLNKFPLQGIELLQGIFQFVSRKAHYTPENSRDTSIITMLKKRLHDHPDSLIGGRYRINDQSGVDKKSLSVQNDYQRYLLDVTDTQSSQRPPPRIRIPITQAGLKFTNGTLDARHIVRASELFESYVACQPSSSLSVSPIPSAIPLTASSNLDRMVLRRAGFGCNATLINYRAVRGLFFETADRATITEKIIDGALFAVIYVGRGGRDAAYLPSLATDRAAQRIAAVDRRAQRQ